MSVNIDRRVAGPDDEGHVADAWRLKEAIREEEGVLKQRRGFFTDAYRRSTVHELLERGGPDEADDHLVGFAAVRRDGYILFLAVHPEFRGEGFGRQLVAAVAEDHRTVTCHARTTNQAALDFYDRLGFDVQRRIDNYYEDGGAAYYLKLGEEKSIRSRLSDLVGR